MTQKPEREAAWLGNPACIRESAKESKNKSKVKNMVQDYHWITKRNPHNITK